MRESFRAIAAEKDDEGTQEKVLRNMPVPDGAGLTYGELFDEAANNDELEPGENFLAFVKRIKEAQSGESYRDAA